MKTIKNIIETNPIILFDGVCNLCDSAVQFVIKKDKKNIFLFAPLQKPEMVSYMSTQKKSLQNIDSIILITNKNIYTKSSAALKIAKSLSGLYPLLYIFYIIPKPIRDLVYDFIAKNRYKWYGKKESCMIPTPEIKNKFL